MARQRGSKTSLRMYEQSDMLTIPGGTPTGLLLPLIDTDVSVSQDLVESRVLGGDRNSREPVPNERGVAGGVTIQPDVRSIGFILKHFFGGLSTGAVAGGLYPHTFTVGDLPAGHLIFEKYMPQIPIALQAFGCRINGISFELGPGGLLEMRLDVIGVDEVNPPVTTPLDATPLSYAMQAFRLPTVTLSEGGGGLTIATRFSIDMSNNIEGIRTIGNLGRYADLPEGIFTASGTLSVLFENMTLYNKALNQTSSSLIVTFPASATPAGQTLQFLFDEVHYALASPGIPGPGGIIAELNWRAFVTTGTSTARAILTNDVASYAAIP
jgi:hypothetical protein